ncbi:MAG: flagellar export chaperone FliS [Bdellovibrionaceae bacterium]|nr:flagellar export chaperone FliS [Pseudobdellovibrionaceae bacterium]
MSKNNYQKYKRTSVESASREKLLLMMYEGAIKYIKKAILAIENNNIAERGMNIGFAYDVIMELNNTLNHEVGGEVAQNLEQLYLFMTDQLIKANIKADKEKLVSVLKILETLYGGWVEAIEKIKKENVAG